MDEHELETIRRRNREFVAAAEEHCQNGGFLFGDPFNDCKQWLYSYHAYKYYCWN